MILTNGEKLLIWRHRHGHSQVRRAKLLATTPFIYGQMERDEKEVPMGVTPVGALAPHERCLIARHRAKMMQSTLAQELGVCRYWVVRMERGLEDCSRLREHWGV
jgi:hypothetical protein